MQLQVALVDDSCDLDSEASCDQLKDDFIEEVRFKFGIFLSQVEICKSGGSPFS